MKNKINEILEANPKISLQEVANKLDISLVEVLKNTDKAKEYELEKIDNLFEMFRGWEKVLLLVITKNFILEIKDKFPKGVYARGYLNFHDKNTSIGGHLSIDNIKHVFFVDDIHFGLRSCSVKFFDKEENEVFSVYVPRNDKKELIQEYLNELLAI